MTDAWKIITLHINATLPDSLEARKELLAALDFAMPPRHAMRADVHAHVATIEAGEVLQRELPLKFKGGSR